MSMSHDEARQLVARVLGGVFDLAAFRQLIANIFPADSLLEDKPISGQYIPEKFRDDVASFRRLVRHEAEGLRMDVLVVKLRSAAKLTRARFMQRNFVARYLNGGWGGTEKDAALVAFYCSDADEWRFSLVYKEYIWGDDGLRTTLSEPRRCSFLVGPYEGTHTAQEQLARLLQLKKPCTLQDLQQAFLVEPITRSFFEEYREHFHRLCEECAALRANHASLRKEWADRGITDADFAKRLLGQLIFLYFLQRKGWLGVKREQPWGSGSRKWLHELYEAHAKTDGHRFFDDYLEQLFYDALARDRSEDDGWHEGLGCRIPFLNGGLFDPLGSGGGYDWRGVDVPLADSSIGAVLETFDRYNFTVREDEPLEKEVAVDPEMLGKVFENLLESERRSDLGTYYTPRDIVHYMCREALVQYLDRAVNVRREICNLDEKPQALKSDARARFSRQERIPRKDLELFIRADELLTVKTSKTALRQAAQERDTELVRSLPDSVKEHAALLDAKLAEVRVCDPAIGSGAFPVAMMHEIVRARQALGSALTDQEGERTSYALKRHAIQHSLYGVDIDASAIDIAKLRLWLSLVVDEDDLAHVRPLPNLDYRIMHGNSLDAMRVSYKNSLLQGQLLHTLQQAQDSYFNTTDKICKQRLRKDIEACRKALGCSDHFEWAIDFHQVFHGSVGEENKGFDIVIANPPYVRQEKITTSKERLKAAFGDFFDGTADIYTYFYALALKQLLTPLGCCCYIAPNKFFRAAYGKNLRSLLTSHLARVLSLIDFGDTQLFDGATTYPAIVLAQRAMTLPQSSVRYCEVRDITLLPQLWHHVQQRGHAVPVSQLAPDGWQLDDPTVTALLRKLQQNSTPLGVLPGVQMYRGVLTGCNEAFVIDGATRRRLLDEDPNSADVIFPWLRGRDLKRWQTEPSGKFVIFTRRGIDIEKYPAIKRHLEQFKTRLEPRPRDWNPSYPGEQWAGRKAGSYKWYEIQDNIAYYKEFSKAKIIWPDMAQKMRVTFDTSTAFCGNTAYFFPTDDLFFLALFNSSVIAFWASKTLAVFQGDTFRFFSQNVSQFPIPLADDAASQSLRNEVAAIIARVQADPAADITAQERKINELVYDLYGLTIQERDMIENDIRQRG